MPAGCGSDDQDGDAVVESTDRTNVMIVWRLCSSGFGYASAYGTQSNYLTPILALTLDQGLGGSHIAHRESQACINCHRKIDPWGIAFENYDGIGTWRDSTAIEESSSPATLSNKSQSPNRRPARKRAGKKPPKTTEADPRTKLANGTDIQNLDDLKAYLLEHKRDQFAETIVRKLLAYSLGRYLEFTETDSVNSLTAGFREDEYRMRDLIVSIVLSDSFKSR